MRITLRKPGKIISEKDLLIAGLFKLHSKSTDTRKSVEKAPFATYNTIKDIDTNLSGYFFSSAHEEGFTADEAQIFSTSSLGKHSVKNLALLGLGDVTKQSLDAFRRGGAESFKLAQRKRAKKLLIVIPEQTSLPMFDVVQAFAEGLLLASYKFDRYHTKDNRDVTVDDIEIELPIVPSAEHKRALIRAEIIADAVFLARDLINEGPSVVNPMKLAEIAKKTAQEADLSITILDEKKLKQERMNLMLAVASATLDTVPPRLIKLHYRPKKPAKRKIVLIGKGITFDTGGLDLKTAEGMLEMKVDMSGAAAVLGALKAIATLAPKTEVIGYMACVENGIGPFAYHPGDIVISRKGISVEIGNTDAEGRLVLADTITYAIDNDKPDTIIDIATLTGASMIALGAKMAALFANDDVLAENLLQSGITVSEAFWRMPLNPNLREVIKSPVADIKNTGDRYGGSITAALFLQEFISEGIKWAHLDIAGPAINAKPHSYLSVGGVGFGIRTLVDYVLGL